MNKAYDFADIEDKIVAIEDLLGGYVGEGNLLDELDWIAEQVKFHQKEYSPQKKLVVLEQFERCTLLFDPNEEASPFIVAFGFDEKTGSYKQFECFSDVSRAHDFADPDIIEGATIKWAREDIKQRLYDFGIKPTEFNVTTTLMNHCGFKRLESCLVEYGCLSGFNVIDETIMAYKDKGFYD